MKADEFGLMSGGIRRRKWIIGSPLECFEVGPEVEPETPCNAFGSEIQRYRIEELERLVVKTQSEREELRKDVAILQAQANWCEAAKAAAKYCGREVAK